MFFSDYHSNSAKLNIFAQHSLQCLTNALHRSFDIFMGVKSGKADISLAAFAKAGARRADHPGLYSLISLRVSKPKLRQ